MDVTVVQNRDVPTGHVELNKKGDDSGNEWQLNVADVKDICNYLDEQNVEYQLEDVPEENWMVTSLLPSVIMIGKPERTKEDHNQHQKCDATRSTSFIILQICIFLLLYTFHNTNKRKISIFLCIIQTISYYKFVRNVKSCVIYIHHLDTSVRLIQQCAQTHARRLSLL